MKILPMVTALTLASTGSVWTRTTDLPHPWLTLDRSAKVLSLQCKPPEVSHKWQAVHDLRLTFLSQRSTSNISLVTVTSNMKEPKVNDLFTIHSVTFQGSWPTVSVSLDFLFPVTDKELGRYFCTVHHTDKDDKLSTFTTKIVVKQDPVSGHIDIQPKNADGFAMEVIETHEVNVTWRSPESQKFAEASVSRVLADEEGTPLAPSMSLFSTNGVRQLVYNSDVLLTKFNPQDNGNLSITLYVESDAHSWSYRYTCRVPYPACTGDGAVYCTCCQGVANPDTQVCPTPPVFLILFIVFLLLFVVAVVVVVVVLYRLHKTKRRHDKGKVKDERPVAGAARESRNTDGEGAPTQPGPSVVSPTQRNDETEQPHEEDRDIHSAGALNGDSAARQLTQEEGDNIRTPFLQP